MKNLLPSLTLLPAVLLAFTSCKSSDSASNPNVQKSETLTVQKGVPGGIFIESYEGNGTITAIDHATRTLSMVRPDGKEGKFQVGPEVRNFPQLQVGDKVKATL